MNLDVEYGQLGITCGIQRRDANGWHVSLGGMEVVGEGRAESVERATEIALCDYRLQLARRMRREFAKAMSGGAEVVA